MQGGNYAIWYIKLVDYIHNVGKSVYSISLIIPSTFSSQKKRKSELLHSKYFQMHYDPKNTLSSS